MADYRKSSVHCHSTLCDGKNSLQEMAGAACARGLTTLGFSGHSYTKPDPEYCMTPGRTAQYRATIAKLKKRVPRQGGYPVWHRVGPAERGHAQGL